MWQIWRSFYIFFQLSLRANWIAPWGMNKVLWLDRIYLPTYIILSHLTYLPTLPCSSQVTFRIHISLADHTIRLTSVTFLPTRPILPYLTLSTNILPYQSTSYRAFSTLQHYQSHMTYLPPTLSYLPTLPYLTNLPTYRALPTLLHYKYTDHQNNWLTNKHIDLHRSAD